MKEKIFEQYHLLTMCITSPIHFIAKTSGNNILNMDYKRKVFIEVVIDNIIY